MSGHLDHGMYDEDNVAGFAHDLPADRTRYFRAILSDPQIEALQKACARMLEDESDWHVNPPTPDERHQLGAAWAVLSNAEVIVP